MLNRALVLLCLIIMAGCKNDSPNLDYEFALLKNVPASLNVEDLNQNPERYSFAVSEQIYGAGYSELASWMRLTFDSTLKSHHSDWILQFYVPVNKTVFYQDENGIWQSLNLNRAKTDLSRNASLIRQTLPLKTVLAQHPVLYFKTVQKDPHSMGHRIIPEAEFFQTNLSEALFWGAIVGLVVFSCVASFAMAIFNKSPLFGYFGLICLMVLSWDLMLLQYAQLLPLPLYGEHYLSIVDGLSVLLSCSILLFVKQFINFADINSLFNKWLNAVPILCVLSLILAHGPVKLPGAHDLMALGSTIAALTVLIGIGLGMVHRKRAAFVIGIAWLPGVGLSFVSIPMFLGLIPETWFTTNVMALGSTMALLMFGVALLDKVYLLRKDRDGLLLDQARMLERKVAEQTEHLQTQTKEIEHQRQILASTLSYKEDLLANIAHELKTPLTLILGVLTGNYEEAERKTKLSRFVYRISHLLDNMLDLSKKQLSSGEQNEQYCYKANEFVEFYLTTYLGFASEGRLVISENEPAEIYCAPDTLDKVITNLINNAIKYSPKETAIEIRAQVRRENWQFIVENKGEGIKPEKLKSVFERYVQVGDANQSYGLGLGLPLVKQLVEAAEGCIEIVSEPYKKTKVTVSIPLATDYQLAASDARGVASDELSDDYRNWLHAELQQPVQQTAATTSVAQGSSRSLIYCIDDNVELLNQLQEQLGERYQLTCFDNPVTALEQAKQSIPDLIISDVMMPQLSGFDVLKQVRDDEMLSHIPVIFLTARADEESRAQGLIGMADDYITKPYATNQLVLKIDNLVAIRNLLKTRFKVDIIEQYQAESKNKIEVLMEDCPTDQKKFMQKVIDCMQLNMGEPEFSIKDLSAQLHLSDSQIRRKVKAITGYSPQDTLRIIRLESAARMIENGESLKAVAVDCGFSSQSHMGSAFKAYFGDTPNQFRANL